MLYLRNYLRPSILYRSFSTSNHFFNERESLFESEPVYKGLSESITRRMPQRGFDPDRRNMPIEKIKLQRINWEIEELQPFSKDFYQEHPEVASMSPEEAQEIRNQNSITVRGMEPPKPLKTIEQAGFPLVAQKILEDYEFKNPTPIQMQAWPIAMSGRDLVGIAQTGSGKTLSFAIPAFIHVKKQPPPATRKSPTALILAPTRELSSQIHKEFIPFGRQFKLNTKCIYGGINRTVHKEVIESGPSVLVATPGRLLDFLNEGIINLKRVTYLVIDEADRMLDMGFEPQIREIISQTRPDRQTLMWSATWPREIRNLSEEFLTNPVHVQVGSEELTANKDIEQTILMVRGSKEQKLIELVQEITSERARILIFTQTKKESEKIGTELNLSGFSVSIINGDRTQGSRIKAMMDFREGKSQILVATEIAARGLDVKDITHVINYDMPSSIESYIHRIGRTGRAGTKGKAISFFTRKDEMIARKLVRVLKEAGQEVPEELINS